MSKALHLKIKWQGPLKSREVVHDLTDGGVKPDWAGNDYGVYQIYGRHLLGKRTDALLYIGLATKQTFSRRFRQHLKWLSRETAVQVFVGRVHHPTRHTTQDRWAQYEADVALTEKLLIYKYSPHYNGRSVTRPPALPPGTTKVVLSHEGRRHRLHTKDAAPGDF